MSDWRVVKMSAADVANGRHIQLQRDFGMIFYTIGAPQDVALFSRPPLGDDPDPFLELYFFSGGGHPVRRPTRGLCRTACNQTAKGAGDEPSRRPSGRVGQLAVLGIAEPHPPTARAKRRSGQSLMDREPERCALQKAG